MFHPLSELFSNISKSFRINAYASNAIKECAAFNLIASLPNSAVALEKNLILQNPFGLTPMQVTLHGKVRR
jgi:hypothetical protein